MEMVLKLCGYGLFPSPSPLLQTAFLSLLNAGLWDSRNRTVHIPTWLDMWLSCWNPHPLCLTQFISQDRPSPSSTLYIH